MAPPSHAQLPTARNMSKKQNGNIIPDRSRPGQTTSARPIGSPQDGREKSATGVTETIKLQTQVTTIGTWNVRTLHACGKINELTHELERYRWDILGLAETRWTGLGETTTEEGHKMWFSGDEHKHQHGVAFLVRKEIVNCVLSCTPISSRVISIRISAKPHNLTIIQVYAPTSDHTDEEIEEFYELLDTAIAKTPKKDILFVQGDWNAKVGPDAYTNWAGTTGRFGTGETNDRGLQLLEFAKRHRLTLANTLHPQKLSRTTTWHSPNGKVHNQIDFILAPQRFKSSINKAKTRTFPGADIGSDHDLVMTSVRLKLKTKRCPRSPRIRFDLEKLNDPNVATIFKAQVGGKFAALNLVDGDVDTLASNIKEVLTSTADEVLGKRKKKIKPWVTDAVLELCDERRKLRKDKYANDAARAKYQEAHRAVRSEMRTAKEAWIEKQCATIDNEMSRGNSKTAYNVLKMLTTTSKPRAMVIDDKDGKLLTDQDEVLKRWTEYCDELYNFHIRPDAEMLNDSQYPTDDEESPAILKREVEVAVRSLKAGKSPGVDNVPAELVKAAGEEAVEALTVLCQKIWNEKKWPEEWTKSLVMPLPKKGNLKKCENYRTISLISHPSKVMLRIILNRLKNKAEELLAEEQAGFRPGRSTVEQIFNCRILMERHLQHQKDLYHNFIDFKKAFDRVWHNGLWHVLRGFNIQKDLIDSIKALYDHASSAVLLNQQVGEAFRTTVGVRQGCLLSPTLFNLFLEKIMQETLHDHTTTISIGGRPICNLRFADDIDLMAGNNAEIQDLTNKLSERASAYGMEISTSKSKVMKNSTDSSPVIVTMAGEQLEEVRSFKYLGATLSKDGTCTEEIRARLTSALAAMTRLSRVWKSPINFKTKFRLYQSIVVPTLLYGCEAWVLLADAERRIQAFETKCFRRLLRISYKDRKTNEYVRKEIEHRVGPQEPLLAKVKRRKLSWFAHTTRHNTLCKTILQGTVEGGRRRGRQRKSWSDNIKEWTEMTTPQLLTVATNRPYWRRLSASASLSSPLRLEQSGD